MTVRTAFSGFAGEAIDRRGLTVLRNTRDIHSFPFLCRPSFDDRLPWTLPRRRDISQSPEALRSCDQPAFVPFQSTHFLQSSRSFLNHTLCLKNGFDCSQRDDLPLFTTLHIHVCFLDLPS